MSLCMTLHTLACCRDNGCGGYTADVVISSVAIASSQAGTHTQKHNNDDYQPNNKSNFKSIQLITLTSQC